MSITTALKCSDGKISASCPVKPGLSPFPQSIAASLDDLLSLQYPEGFWVGELEADISLESDVDGEDYFGFSQP
jgi:hypothetical protein